VQAVLTSAPGQATEIARQAAAAGANPVIAAGGDDTVREVVRGLVSSSAALGIVPLGTFNNLAFSLELPHDPLRALAIALEGETGRMDLGVLDDGQIFTESLGVGFDAAAWLLRPEEEPVGLRRWLVGLDIALRSLPGFRPPRILLALDGRLLTTRAMQVTVANTRYFGAWIQMTPQARTDDGLLDVCVVPRMSKLAFLAAFGLFFQGRHLEALPEIHYYQAREIRIESTERLPVRVDGRVSAHLPVVVRVLPGAIPVRLPRREK
jgi:YegS/Rv2252/BmrU family lipid kinase